MHIIIEIIEIRLGFLGHLEMQSISGVPKNYNFRACQKYKAFLCIKTINFCNIVILSQSLSFV